MPWYRLVLSSEKGILDLVLQSWWSCFNFGVTVYHPGTILNLPAVQEWQQYFNLRVAVLVPTECGAWLAGLHTCTITVVCYQAR
jgi:hypothetical protein